MDLQFEYVEGQGRPGFAVLLADYQRRSDEVNASAAGARDVPYGPHARQVFDHFPPTAQAQGVLLYLHAGYWQSRDKSHFRFLAPFFQARGFHVFMLNYPLCPEVSLAELVSAVRPSVPAVRRFLDGLGVRDLPLVVSGHSAGGHLAVELALAAEDASTAVQGVWGISGVYDPEPLVCTTLNQKLRLTSVSAREANVTLRVRRPGVPGLWTVGGSETAAFLAQNAAMHDAWRAQGHPSECLVVAQADHFTVLQACIEPDGPCRQVFDAWWAQAQAAARQQDD